jgi:hypothetical protein
MKMSISRKRITPDIKIVLVALVYCFRPTILHILYLPAPSPVIFDKSRSHTIMKTKTVSFSRKFFFYNYVNISIVLNINWSCVKIVRTFRSVLLI